MITIYTICYNEELMLPFFIRHYRKQFPDCKIVVYDNQSSDSSVSIAKAAGCEVITYDTGGKLDDAAYLQIKNNCWKEADDTDWVLVCDVDEHFTANNKTLSICDIYGYSIVKSEGWNMTNMADDLDIEAIEMGVRAPSYDKIYAFNKRKIKEVNYSPGCHGASPLGDVVVSTHPYICKHYKYINIDYMIDRHAMFAKRMSPNNRAKGYGAHYDYPPERIRQEFENARLNAQIVL